MLWGQQQATPSSALVLVLFTFSFAPLVQFLPESNSLVVVLMRRMFLLRHASIVSNVQACIYGQE